MLSGKILQLLKAYCYPSLNYASSVWLTPSLNAKLKSNLFLASGKILSTIKVDSYRNLHKIYKPEMWQNYELTISLYDLTNTKLPNINGQLLQGKILQNRRSTELHFTSTNKLWCGLKILPNRFKTITNRINASWLNLTKETYKQNCKKEFNFTITIVLICKCLFCFCRYLVFNFYYSKVFFCEKSSLQHI